jgi:hypothetical protein
MSKLKYQVLQKKNNRKMWNKKKILKNYKKKGNNRAVNLI